MERVTLSKTTVQVVHQTVVELEQTILRYAGTVLELGGPAEPPTDGWAVTAAAFYEPRKATSYINAVRKMAGVAEVQKRVEKPTYLPLEVDSWSAERGSRLRLVLKGKNKGTIFNTEFEKDGLVFGSVGRSNPVARYFKPEVPERVPEALPAPPGSIRGEEF